MSGVTAIFARLRNLGIQIQARGENIWLSQAPPRYIDEEIASNRAEILFHLRRQVYQECLSYARELSTFLDDQQIAYAERESRLSEYQALTDRLAELQGWMDYYEENGTAQWYTKGWLLVHSDLLGETICIVRDASIDLPPGAGNFPRYLFCEVEALKSASADTVRSAHKVKTAFRGTVKS